MFQEYQRVSTIDTLQFAGMRAFFALRSRYAEDRLEEAVANGISNYIILGAGLDSFAFRRPDLMEKLDVYEVDHPASQTWKRQRLAELSVSLPARLHFVPADFERQTLTEMLHTAGLLAGSLGFFSWVGVTQYLPRDIVLDTLRQIAIYAGSGSEVVIQFILPPAKLENEDRDLIEILARHAAGIGEPWLSFFEPDDMEQLLRRIGFTEIAHFGPIEAAWEYLAGRSDGMSFPGYFGFVKARIA